MRTPALFLLSLFCYVNANSQITVTTSDFADAGDTVRMSEARFSFFSNFRYKYGGADTVWDFSSFTPRTQRVDEFLNIYQTNAVYAIYFGNVSFNSRRANLATRAEEGTATSILIPVVITEPFNFFYKTNDAYIQRGIGERIDGIPTSVGYNGNDTVYKFPMKYGDVNTSTYGYDYRIPKVFYSEHTEKRTNNVDGWGKVITPFGTFDVLRCISKIEASDSTYIDTLDFGFRQNQPTVRQYKWIAKDQGEPVVQITTESVFGFEVITDIVYRDSARNLNPSTDIINVNNQPAQFTIYPNPATNLINVFCPALTNDAELTITDLSGRIVHRQKMVQSTEQVNTMGWAAGVYLTTVSNGQSRSVRKLVIE